MKSFQLLSIILICAACNNHEPQPSAQNTTSDSSSTAAQNFFPVYDFLKSEIAAVNAASSGIKKYTTSGNQNDSVYIQPEEFNKLAQEFLSSALTDSIFKKEFTETSFIDKATQGSTFYYSTKNPAIELKRVDVVTRKTDTYDKVRSIYLEKTYSLDTNNITKKLHWKPGRNFQIITLTSKGTELVKVVWDNRE